MLAVVCAGVLQIGSCTGGLERNLQHGAGIDFGIDGLEMVGFTFESGCIAASGPGMFEFICESGCSAADGLEIVDFIGQSSCSVARGLEMVEIGSLDVDGLEMGVCNGYMCWQLWQ